MQGVPGAMFIIDSSKEDIAILEAQKMNIPIIAIVDTNGDPENLDLSHPRQRRRRPGHRALHQQDGRGHPGRQEVPASRRPCSRDKKAGDEADAAEDA